jgi:hypothetical protein
MRDVRVCCAIIAVIFICSLPVAAVQCDCNHFPWSPDCIDVCGALILNQSSKAELTTFLHLDNSTAQKIVSLKASKPAKGIESLKVVEAVLPPDKFKDLVNSLVKLKPLEAQYLTANPGNKKDFREMVRAAPPSAEFAEPGGPPYDKQ